MINHRRTSAVGGAAFPKLADGAHLLYGSVAPYFDELLAPGQGFLQFGGGLGRVVLAA